MFAAAAFTRPGQPRSNVAAILGGFAPDASLYALVGYGAFVLGRSESELFGRDYFSPAWQTVFAIDNSIFVWSLVLLLGVWSGLRPLAVFAGAALLHIAFDLPLHHDDGRPHFWPLTDWVYESPISYWDHRRHGDIVGVVEVVLVLGLAVLLWRRFKGWFARAAIVACALAEAAPFVAWSLMFG